MLLLHTLSGRSDNNNLSPISSNAALGWALLERPERAAHADAGMLCRVQVNPGRRDVRVARQTGHAVPG